MMVRRPTRLLPVVQQSVIEFATLGFVGLIIETIDRGGPLKRLLNLCGYFLHSFSSPCGQTHHPRFAQAEPWVVMVSLPLRASGSLLFLNTALVLTEHPVE